VASTAAWTTDGFPARDAFFARLDLAPGGEPVTEDAYFLDTLDEIGVMGIRGQRLRMGVGDNPQDGESGIESMDLFEVELMPDHTPRFTNLTLSSGDSQAPFLTPGTIEVDWMLRIPGADALLVYDGDGERVIAVDDGQIGARVLLDQVKDVYWIEPAGDWIAFAARRTFDPRPRDVYRLPGDIATPATLLVAGGSNLDHLGARGNARGWLGFLTSMGAGLEQAHLVHVPTGTRRSHPSGPGSFGRTLGFDRRGALLLRLGSDGEDATFEAWSLSGARTPFSAPAGPGTCLPGR
jgi:hypothetical protein